MDMIKNNPVENAAHMAKELAEELISIGRIKKQKYIFKEAYLDKIIEMWKSFPGKSTIHLLDLPDHFTAKFSAEGMKEFRRIYDSLKNRGLDTLRRRYGINPYLIHDLLITGRTKYLTIRSIRNIIRLVSRFSPELSEISKIEKEVIGIKSGRRSKLQRLNGFPIRLNDVKWASIFGIIYDTHLKKFNFATIDKRSVQEINQDLARIGNNYRQLNHSKV